MTLICLGKYTHEKEKHYTEDRAVNMAYLLYSVLAFLYVSFPKDRS